LAYNQREYAYKAGIEMDLNNYTASHGAKKFYREVNHRVFVNRSLHLEKIKFFGFDMDYTLAEYKSPELESAAFKFAIERLISMGYPSAISDFEYDSKFAIRGLWFDTLHGNFLKVDPYGNILVCVHGFEFLKTHEIYDLYPNKFVQLNEQRIYVLNSLFNQPETYLLACIVDYFSNSKEFTKTPDGVKKNADDLFMPYRSIHTDIRHAFDWVHDQGSLKKETLSNLDKYIMKDERLPLLFDRMREHNKKIFLLTNSDYQYTDKIMDYLFDVKSANGRKWTKYFDYIVVDARKPLFFSEGTILRQVDTKTGALKIGAHVGPIEPGRVYSGGSCDVFTQLIGAKGRDVLYVGDHIFGDILKSKKKRGWRTFLVIPELQRELEVWENKNDLFVKLQVLDIQLGDLYKDLDSSTNIKPDLTQLRTDIRKTIHEMDMSYGILGSLFRCGSRQTHFANQVTRFADIYGSTCLNLFYYPFCYMFRAPAMLMSHESTVEHTSLFDISTNVSLNEALKRLQAKQLAKLNDAQKQATDEIKKADEEQKRKVERKDSQVPHSKPAQPTEITHDADFDSDEADSN